MSRSTQKQALSALVLLYREVLAVSVGDLRQVLRSNSPTRLPAVLSRGEVRMLLGRLHATNGTMGLITLLLYGAVCACWSACRSASRISTLRAERSGCGVAKGERIV